MSRPHLALATLLLSLVGCDKVQELVGGGEEGDAKAEAQKADDAKTPAAAAGDAKTPDAKTADAKAADAKAPDAAPADAKAPDAKAADAPVADAGPAEALPCIIGSWDATDYTAAVRRAIAKDPTLRSFK